MRSVATSDGCIMYDGERILIGASIPFAVFAYDDPAALRGKAWYWPSGGHDYVGIPIWSTIPHELALDLLERLFRDRLEGVDWWAP